jgi:hypothetical protein
MDFFSRKCHDGVRSAKINNAMLGAPAVRVRLFVGITADRQAADFLVKEKATAR